MSSSRPFSIPLPTADPAGEPTKLAAFVPFIDMANHDEEPNCEVQGVAEGRGISAVGLVARRDLAEGEEVLISYFDAAPNSHIFSRFGFVPSDGNRHDRLH